MVAGEVVAQFEATVLVMPKGLLKIADLPLNVNLTETDTKSQDPGLIATSYSQLKKKKKKPARKNALVRIAANNAAPLAEPVAAK